MIHPSNGGHAGHALSVLVAYLRLHSLQALLWAAWTAAVIAMAAYQWHRDAVQHIPLEVAGLVVHCLLVGSIGLIVITEIELWLLPGAFDR
jgi:hypothetical protein